MTQMFDGGVVRPDDGAIQMRPQLPDTAGVIEMMVGHKNGPQLPAVGFDGLDNRRGIARINKGNVEGIGVRAHHPDVIVAEGANAGHMEHRAMLRKIARQNICPMAGRALVS